MGRLVEAAVAHMMGNTSAAWDATYDVGVRRRALERVLALWPSFKAWVQAEAAKQSQQVPRNPLQS